MNRKKYYVPIKGISSVKFKYTTYLEILAHSEDEAVQKALDINPDEIREFVADPDLLECGLLKKDGCIRKEIILSMRNGKFIIDDDREVTLPIQDEDEKVS